MSLTQSATNTKVTEATVFPNAGRVNDLNKKWWAQRRFQTVMPASLACLCLRVTRSEADRCELEVWILKLEQMENEWDEVRRGRVPRIISTISPALEKLPAKVRQ